MAERRVVVTGAHSYLGNRTIEHLLEQTDVLVDALVTPWANDLPRQSSRRVSYHRADLLANLSADILHALASADRVLHFAWVRGLELDVVCAANEDIVARLLDAVQSPDRFVFISSVAASPRSLSHYGRSKYHVMELVQRRGGISLVCGLVVASEPKGPYLLLSNVLRSLPIRLRLFGPTPKVFPVHIDHVLKCVQRVVESRLPLGNYRMFVNEAPRFNDFLSEIERRYRRFRIPISLPTALVVLGAKSLRRLQVGPAELGEKMLTFLWKDTEYVLSHLAMPDVESQVWSSEFLAWPSPQSLERDGSHVG